MSNPAVLAHILELISRVAGGQQASNPNADTPLADEGFWLDSLGILELLVACEQTFGIYLDASELTPEQLRTAGSLAALIDSRLKTSGASRG